MVNLDSFHITQKWSPQFPERIQLYSLATPNGVKVSAMLEETELAYEAHKVDFATADQKSSEFLSLNPNGKIPAIIDPNGPNGQPLPLWESGAILIYLAEKVGKFMTDHPARKYETLQWLMWQMGALGPMGGQVGFFNKFAGKDYEDRRPFEKYRDEVRRLLGVLDQRLEGREFTMGDEYTIADISCWPWIRNLDGFYEAGEHIELATRKNVVRWMETCLARPASQKAINIPARD